MGQVFSNRSAKVEDPSKDTQSEFAQEKPPQEMRSQVVKSPPVADNPPPQNAPKLRQASGVGMRNASSPVLK